MEAIEAKNGEVWLRVRVQPKASRNEIRRDPEGRIRVALTAPPVEGAANRALLDVVSAFFGIPKRRVRLVTGDKSREKTVALEGVGVDEVQARLGAR